jgi:hypothetical protein
MKTIKLPLILAILIAFSDVTTLADPGYPDTVKVDSVAVMAGGTVALPVNFYNDEVLSGVEIVLDYDNDYLQIDSFSLDGGRFADFTDLTIIFRDSANLINLYLYDTYQFIQPGNGLLCNFFFTSYDSAGGQTFTINNGYWPFGQYDTMTTRFIDSAVTCYIYPEFVDGKIHVVELPPSPDSIWVDRITGTPGQTVSVDIYGYNVEPLTEINLALQYSSDNLIYNDTSFAGTRGATAISKSIDLRSQLRQILITLDYNEVTPLSPGSGPLATILFDIEATSPDEMVIIDSTTFLGSQSLEFTLTLAEGGISFTPYFTYGYVDIITSTDIKERYDPIIPLDFSLAQNVPNPFNPTTLIRFELPRESNVKLNVINILGRRVKTLVDKPMPAGVHTVTFDGKGDNEQTLASGVYFYRLETEDFSQSRKMILMK